MNKVICATLFKVSETSRCSKGMKHFPFRHLISKSRSLCAISKEKATNKDEMNHFGFEVVTNAEKRQKVQTVFTNVASKYDLMNDVMSAGVHRLWKDYFIQMLSPTPGTKLLDVACGTGDIAFRFLQATNEKSNYIRNRFTNPLDEESSTSELEGSNEEKASRAVVLDMNADMISICKQRAKDSGLSEAMTCVIGTAEALPFADNTFDAYTIAFGIRNVALIDEALFEAHRVLRHGGRFLCLEFSQVENPVLSWFYDQYSMQIIPCLGQIIAGDWKSYQYLVESIRKFPTKEDFQYKIEDAGFRMVTYTNLFNGIAAIHSGYKL